MWANVENYTGEGSVSAFDDGNVFHSRTETRCRHIVVGAVVVLVLAVNSCWIIFKTCSLNINFLPIVYILYILYNNDII